MDQYDRAQMIDAASREAAIAAQRSKAPHGVSAEECEDCGAPIPEERRVAIPGVQRCVDCQGILEQKQKRGLR